MQTVHLTAYRSPSQRPECCKPTNWSVELGSDSSSWGVLVTNCHCATSVLHIPVDGNSQARRPPSPKSSTSFDLWSLSSSFSGFHRVHSCVHLRHGDWVRARTPLTQHVPGCAETWVDCELYCVFCRVCRWHRPCLHGWIFWTRTTFSR